MNRMNQVLSSIDYLNYKILLFGDFNVNFMAPNGDSIALTEMVSTFNLSALIGQPTRVTRESATCIDNCFTNTDAKQLLIQIHDSMMSDHYSIYLKLMNCDLTKQIKQYIYQRQFDQRSLGSFCNVIGNIKWEDDGDAPIDIINNFFDYFHDAFAEGFPIRKKMISNGFQRPKWYTQELKTKNEILKVLKIMYVDTKNKESMDIYKKYSEEYKQLVMQTKLSYNR